MRSQKQKKALAKLVAASSVTHERMSRSEIQSWVHAADKLGDDFDFDDDDDDSGAKSAPASGDPAQEWQAFLSLARRRVTQTSTRARIEFVRERLLAVAQRGGMCFCSMWDTTRSELTIGPNVDLDVPQALDVFLVLALTYPRYVDTNSRSAALDTLRVLVQRDSAFPKSSHNQLDGLLDKIARWLHNESSRISSPASRRSADVCYDFSYLLNINLPTALRQPVSDSSFSHGAARSSKPHCAGSSHSQHHRLGHSWFSLSLHSWTPSVNPKRDLRSHIALSSIRVACSVTCVRFWVVGGRN